MKICCSICLENIPVNNLNTIKQFECNHEHHITCIKEWNGNCPDCRSKRKNRLESIDYINSLKSIHQKVPQNFEKKYREKWTKETCIKQNHKLTFLKTYGVIGLCESCYKIQAYNLMH